LRSICETGKYTANGFVAVVCGALLEYVEMGLAHVVDEELWNFLGLVLDVSRCRAIDTLYTLWLDSGTGEVLGGMMVMLQSKLQMKCE